MTRLAVLLVSPTVPEIGAAPDHASVAPCRARHAGERLLANLAARFPGREPPIVDLHGPC